MSTGGMTGSTGGGGSASTGGGSASASTGASMGSTGSMSASTGGSTGASLGSTGASLGSTFTASTGSSSGVSFAWNDGWRERLANGDAKELTRLQRFAQPEDIFRSFRELERRMSAGELRTMLPANARPEEVTQWRKENGVPEKPDDYLSAIKFDDGLVIGDEDKAQIGEFLKAAHGAHYTPSQVKGALEWYLTSREATEAAQQDNDTKVARTTQDALRAAWPGAEYRANMNAVHGFLDQAPPVVFPDGSKVPLKDLILGARLPNGVAIGSSPEALQWFAHVAREINPAATVVPGAGANQMQSIDDEIASLKSIMGNKQGEYWKGPKADQHQARYRQLVEAKQKMQERGKAAG